jgi:glycosyltransferase involved in cell wall biosynthesis
VPSLFVVDIDFRGLGRRLHETGLWSRRAYVFDRCLYEPWRRMQVWLAVRTSDLVLLKSPSMAAAYGKGRPQVKDFLDAAHGTGALVTEAGLEARLAARGDPDRPLQAIFFGRFVPYKGIDYMLDAVELALAKGVKVHLTLVGTGECLAELEARAGAPALRDAVTFIPPVPYGPKLFELLDRADVALATPKSEDTPRAALDAMARGLPIVAFDIDYFRNLAEKSGAVALARWPSPASLAEMLESLAADRPRIAGMSRRARAFASDNTQDIWLEKRIAWTMEAYAARAQGVESAKRKGRVPTVPG